MTRTITVCIVLAFCVVQVCGCAPASRNSATATQTYSQPPRTFAPTRIRIIPLTQFINDNPQQYPRLKVYVDLLDDFDSQMKSPGLFRFELYEYIPRAGRAKGKRILIWPDFDLTKAKVNAAYWRDFLRSYEFTLALDFEPQQNSKYVVQANYISTAGERLSADFTAQYK